MPRLSGTVTVHGNKPATTAVVEIHNSSGDIVDQVQVDASGGYTYHLATGSWFLTVWDAHGHRGKAQVTMTPDDDQTMDLDLDEPEGGH